MKEQQNFGKFDELKKAFENLEEKRSDNIRDSAERIKTGLTIYEMVIDSFGKDSYEFKDMMRNLSQKNLNPRDIIADVKSKHGSKGVEELEDELFDVLELDEESNTVVVKIGTRQVYNTTERTYKIYEKNNDEKGVYSKSCLFSR